MDEQDLRVEIGRKQFLYKVAVAVNMCYISTLMCVIDSVFAHKISCKKYIYWTVCKWDLLVLSMEPAAAASIVICSSWFHCQHGFLMQHASYSVLPSWMLILSSPLGFVHLSTSLPNSMLLFHSLEISCILPKLGPPNCQTLLSVFGVLRLL